jgi:hypothetical protein
MRTAEVKSFVRVQAERNQRIMRVGENTSTALALGKCSAAATDKRAEPAMTKN